MNRKARRAIKRSGRRMAVINKEQRYRDLLGRIDGGLRKAKLEEELELLRKAFMEAYGHVERQEAFLKKHESELSLLKKKEPDTQHVSREAIVRSIKEKLALMRLSVEHLADEVEKMEGRIKEINEAGLPKADDPLDAV